MKFVETKNAPAAIGPYSQGVISGGFLFTSGQIPLDPETGNVVGETIEEETTRVIENLKSVIEAAGSSIENVLKTTCFLSDMKYFAKFNEIYSAYFVHKPARSCFAVKELPKGVLVEVEAIVEIKN